MLTDDGRLATQTMQSAMSSAVVVRRNRRSPWVSPRSPRARQQGLGNAQWTENVEFHSAHPILGLDSSTVVCPMAPRASFTNRSGRCPTIWGRPSTSAGAVTSHATVKPPIQKPASGAARFVKRCGRPCTHRRGVVQLRLRYRCSTTGHLPARVSAKARWLRNATGSAWVRRRAARDTRI